MQLPYLEEETAKKLELFHAAMAYYHGLFQFLQMSHELIDGLVDCYEN